MSTAIEDICIEKEDGVVVVLSDLHLGEGYIARKRVFARAENFFQDGAFQSLLDRLSDDYAGTGKPITLILNGDFLDFLRVRSLPSDHEHKLFQRYLQRIGRGIRSGEFAIDNHEKLFGLHSHELKSVWKLRHISEGHPRVFAALAEFIVNGNRLIIVKGNHDLEFYWPTVQREFLKILASKLPAVNGVYKSARERMEYLQNNVQFSQRAVIIEDTIYVEHGHQYQPITSVPGPPMRNGELLFPPGSIMNRYLINFLETIAPFVANIRPTSAVLRSLAFKEKIKALRIILRFLPVAIKNMYRYYHGFGFILLFEAFPYLLGIGYAILGIVLPMVWDSYAKIYLALTGKMGSFLVENWFLNLALTVLAFFGLEAITPLVGRTHHFHLDKALKAARERLPDGIADGKQRFAVFSHTHRAEVRSLENGWWYLNSGTWIPIVDRQEFVLHEKLTLSYILFEKDKNNRWDFQMLQWNDDKGKSEPLILLERVRS